jgi:hypothetical protein
MANISNVSCMIVFDIDHPFITVIAESAYSNNLKAREKKKYSAKGSCILYYIFSNENTYKKFYLIDLNLKLFEKRTLIIDIIY